MMKSLKPWVSALGVTEELYGAWIQALPKNQSFTFWCLITGKIRAEDYLRWASEHFGLAILRTEFFRNEPNRTLWKNIKSVANWSVELVPLMEWDGTLFVGCVEPMDVQWSFPVVYVLAPAHDLKNYWDELQTVAEISFPDIPPVPDQQAESMNLHQEASHQKTLHQESPHQEAPPALDQSRVLEQNLAPIAKEQNFSPIAEEHNISPMPDHPTPVAHEEEAPTGLNIIKFSQVSAPPSVDLMEELSRKIKSTTKNIDLNKPDNLNWNLDDIDTGLLEKMPLPPQQTSTLTGLNTNFLKPTSQPTAAVTDNERAEPPTQVVQQFVGILQKLKNDCIGGMILSIHADQVKAITWDENFKVANAKATGFWALNTPSAFRIAYRTKMPYLGHVVETQTNQDFFSSWGFTQMPKSILIQPVKTDERVTHLLLALVDGTKKNHQILNIGEKFADEITFLLSYRKAA